ncbi:hypothetical protein EDF64_11178 [Curtobacterium flaccumfaciens]|uniref:Aminoglycoside phosphotransferase family protein n=2 Tax=Curtobacterium flaccumfaciens TaxID=2035 RepID=A0A4R6DDH1_9MICO|nr:hypothetical protein EDF64_11178 [Curtobacterium flaccumfaciens]
MTWDAVPNTLRRRVEGVLGGEVVEAVSQAEGYSPGSADRVVVAGGGRAFVKTVSQSRNAGAFGLHGQEAHVMALLPPSVRAPRLLATLEDTVDGDDWIALVLADVDGRHPGETRDGADVAAVLDALDTLPVATGALAARPRLTNDLAGEFGAWDRMLAIGLPATIPRHVAAEAQRLARTARGSAALVDGEHLTHVDCRADNLLVDAVGQVWLLDWPWAAVGAHWFDPLTYLLDVLVRGEATDVEEHLAVHPVFAGLDATTVDAVLAGLAGTFFEKAARPAIPNMPTLRDFQRREGLAAAEWLLRRWTTR